MNNRYIFRGKGNPKYNDGEWYYGYLTYDGSDYQIVDPEYGSCKRTIIPETVRRCTELKDKNGKWIFEGDIVRTQPFSDKPYSSKAKYKRHIGVVEYRISHFKNSLYEQDYKAEWRVNIKDYGKFTCYDWSEFFKCEVIGNIHDDKSLLEVER